MGNFLPKYPKNYFKNQKGLRSFWKMISIGISIIFGILACIDKFEKQWELNVFYFGIALLLFYIFIHPVWMDAKKKKGYKTAGGFRWMYRKDYDELKKQLENELS